MIRFRHSPMHFGSDVQNGSLCELTVVCHYPHPVTVWSLPFLRHSHHPNVVGGASLQCSQDRGVTADSRHLQGPFWWNVHLPWFSGVPDSVGHSSPSKSKPHHCQSRCSVNQTWSDTYTPHFAGWYSASCASGTCMTEYQNKTHVHCTDMCRMQQRGEECNGCIVSIMSHAIEPAA